MYPIDFFWRAARRWPERVAIQTSSTVWHYASLASAVTSVANSMIALDPEPQSRVGIACSNTVEHVIAWLAVLACGKTWVPLNVKSTEPEIRRILELTEPSIIVLDPDCGRLVAGSEAVRIFTRADLRGMALEDIIGADRPSSSAPKFDLPKSATQAIKFTGGTTGLPKGVMQSYLAWNACIVNLVHAWQLSEADRYVVAAPITHGTSTYLLPVLAQGGALVMPDGKGAVPVHRAFRDHRGTIAFMPPTLIYMLMALSEASKSDFSSLRLLIYAGAPMPPDKVREAIDYFGPVLGTTYGQTEAPQILTWMGPADFEDAENWKAVGRPSWFTDLAVMSEDGSFAAAGVVGEVIARGDLVMSGYYKNPELTSEVLVEGWLRTGDRGVLSEDGRLFLKDRLKDMVITGGFNVYPGDVENALGRHCSVHECAVFGVPDNKWGEAVHAAVQLKPGSVIAEAELIAFVRERLGPVHAPKKIHFYPDLPRSAVGKVLKTTLKAQAMDGRD